jgi:hypothetical protein
MIDDSLAAAWLNDMPNYITEPLELLQDSEGVTYVDILHIAVLLIRNLTAHTGKDIAPDLNWCELEAWMYPPLPLQEDRPPPPHPIWRKA